MVKRVNRSAAQWRALFSEQKRSGKEVKEFCAARHINTNSFYSKRKKLRGRRERFIEIKPVLVGGRAPVVVETGGLRIEVHDRAALREVLQTAREAAC